MFEPIGETLKFRKFTAQLQQEKRVPIENNNTVSHFVENNQNILGKQIIHTSSKNESFFKMPHRFEEKFGSSLTPTEKYFYVILRKLANRCANSTSWFWHTDKQFVNYGFSISTSKRSRKKLHNLGLIETKCSWYRTNRRKSTMYKLMDTKF